MGKCRRCRGAGKLRTRLSYLEQEVVCPSCGGTGVADDKASKKQKENTCRRAPVRR